MEDFRTIIEKLKIYLADENKKKVLDKDVANLLGMSQARFATLKKRNVFPYEELLLFCKEASYSSDRLFFK